MAFELERTNQCSGTAELIERKKAQRIPHEDRETTAAGRAVLQATQHDRVGRQAKIGLCLATAGGKKEKIDSIPVAVCLVGEAVDRQENEGELEWSPSGRRPVGGRARAPLRIPIPAAGRDRHGPIRGPKGVECQWFIGKRFDSGLDPLSRCLHIGKHARHRLSTRPLHASENGCLRVNPGAVLLDQGRECCRGGSSVDKFAEGLHAERHSIEAPRLDSLHRGIGDPLGLDRSATSMRIAARSSRHAMAHGMIHDIAVLHVGDALVGVVASGGSIASTKIWPCHEVLAVGWAFEPHSGLKHESAVGAFQIGRPLVDKKHCDASCPRRQATARERRRRYLADGGDQLQPLRTFDRGDRRFPSRRGV